MKIHILGICGTFMAGVAILAKQQGISVTGSDENIYPPMSTQLAEENIEVVSVPECSAFATAADEVVIGNALSRGKPQVENVLNQGLRYTSGPQWLYENILANRTVLAVTGTHGKTTTSSMLAWILEYAGLNPGFLIGGIPKNFGRSARLGQAPYFVIEGDEYDCAFFDKRSKFLHYRPQIVIMNNLEYDHADIFADLAAIQQQFQFLVRTVPGNGFIIYPGNDENLQQVLARGCWSTTTTFASAQADWQVSDVAADGSRFTILYQQQKLGTVQWNLLGQHNVANAQAAVIAAACVGVAPKQAIAALCKFTGVLRRMEVKGCVNNITVYDDFAHHPTAIATTLQGLYQHKKGGRIFAVLELASYTMRQGVLKDQLISALQLADFILVARPAAEAWGLAELVAQFPKPTKMYETVDDIVADLAQDAQAGDHILIMNKTHFGNIHAKLLQALQDEKATVLN